MSYFYRVLLDEVNELRLRKDKNGELIENDDLRMIIDGIDNLEITDRMLRLSIYKEEFGKLEVAKNKGEEYIVKEKLDIQKSNHLNEDYSSLFQ